MFKLPDLVDNIKGVCFSLFIEYTQNGTRFTNKATIFS